MKTRFKISFYALLFGWLFYMMLLLILVYSPEHNKTLANFMFFTGFTLCITGTFGFIMLGEDDDFFSSRERIKEVKKELSMEKIKTAWLNNVIAEKINEIYNDSGDEQTESEQQEQTEYEKYLRSREEYENVDMSLYGLWFEQIGKHNRDIIREWYRFNDPTLKITNEMLKNVYETELLKPKHERLLDARYYKL